MVRREGGQDSVGGGRVKGDFGRHKSPRVATRGLSPRPHLAHPAPLNRPAGTAYTGLVPPAAPEVIPTSNENPSMRPLLPLAFLAWSLQMTARADEGMWLLNDPPRDHLKTKYGFDLTDAWLTRAQKSAVRFTNGASGGFVSADGLVVTNHHVGADCLQKLSTPEKDLIKTGFRARSREEEVKCVDLEL